jgi:hypothetical protein
MNKLGRFLLVISALAPVLGAFAINAYSQGDCPHAVWYAVIGILLVVVCLLCMWGCRYVLPKEPLKTAKVKSADKEILSFLIVYLLPLLSQNVIAFKGDLFTAVYVGIVVVLCVYHSNAITFNPVLGMVGYHFYEVESGSGMSYLLLSRQVYRRQDNELSVVQISDYVYLDIS